MQPLLLLHGAIGASVQLSRLAGQLRNKHNVYTLDFSGHGGSTMPDQPFSIELFAGNVLNFMAREGLDKVSIFGYSMGGYVGMYLARHYPEKINKVATLATKYHWDETIAAREIKMLDASKIEQKLPAFADELSKMHHPEDWKVVLRGTASMMEALGKNNTVKPADYVEITTPVLMLLGDRDKMVSLDETFAVYQSLPNAQMGILPNTPHPINQVDTTLLAAMIDRFMK